MPRLLEVVERAPESLWTEFVEATPGTTVYQTPAWGRVCEEAFPLCSAAARYYRFDDADVLLPGTVTPALAGRSRMFHSVRPSDYGGFVSAETLTPAHVSAIARDLRRSGFVRVWLYGNPFATAAAAHEAPVTLGSPEDPQGGAPSEVPGFDSLAEWTQAVPLHEGYDHVWMERLCKNSRRSVRKAEKSGVEVTPGDAGDIAELYRLYLLSAQRWGDTLTWLRPRELAEAAFRETDSALWIARCHGKVVGASLDYFHQSICFAGWRAFDEDNDCVKVSYALVANSIKAACERGCTFYDMGASAGLKGVEEFKQRFGAVPLTYGRWTWEHPAYTAISKGRKGISHARSSLHLVAGQ